MVTRAVLRYVRISPRKVRPVIPLIKGKNPEEAIAILLSVKKRASEYLIDLLKSAMANAKRIQGIEIGDLYISNLIASGGPQMKRFRAASMGRAGAIRKRTSHITLELDQRAAKAPDAKAAAKAETKQQAAPAKAAAAAKAKKPAATTAPAAKKARAKEPAKPESGKKGKE
jgi:large subunit ribosomal protein L22